MHSVSVSDSFNFSTSHHGEIQGNDDAKAVPFTSLHWSQTLNCWNGCWICKSLDFAKILFFGFPWGSYGSRRSCRKGTMREVCGARYVRLGSEVALLIQIVFSRFQPAFVGISCKLIIYKWFVSTDCGLLTSRYGVMQWISCWWMTPRQISMWNVHMWPSSALDLTPVGVCNGETNPLDLCWYAISKNMHVLIFSFGPSKLLIWRPKNHWSLVIWPWCTGRKVEHSRSTSQCKDVTWCGLFGQLRVSWLSICTFSERYLVKGEGDRRRLHWILQMVGHVSFQDDLHDAVFTDTCWDGFVRRKDLQFAVLLVRCFFIPASFFIKCHQSKTGPWTKLNCHSLRFFKCPALIAPWPLSSIEGPVFVQQIII